MELLKHRKSAPEDPEANWNKKGVFSRILEHSKIIEGKYFIKIKADQEMFNFETYSTYEASNKIVWLTETWWNYC